MTIDQEVPSADHSRTAYHTSTLSTEFRVIVYHPPKIHDIGAPDSGVARAHNNYNTVRYYERPLSMTNVSAVGITGDSKYTIQILVNSFGTGCTWCEPKVINRGKGPQHGPDPYKCSTFSGGRGERGIPHHLGCWLFTAACHERMIYFSQPTLHVHAQ